MPRRDKTGPQGLGSMTRRGLGICNPTGVTPGFAGSLKRGFGIGSGRGTGTGRGRGRGRVTGQGGRNRR